MFRFLRVGLVLALSALPAFGLSYKAVLGWPEINGTGTSTTAYAIIADGDSAYCQLSLANSPRITRVDGLSLATRTTTELVSTAQWIAAGGGSSGITAFYGFSSFGSYLQFTDSISDAVWRVDKSSGAITPYVTKAQIKAFTGTTSDPASLTGFDTAPDGEIVWYESTSKQLLKSTGLGTMSTLITTAQLTSLMGTIACTSMTFTPDGTMYISNSSTDAIYKRDTAGNLSTILTGAYILAKTGGTSMNFKDIFAAPDGWIYFQEQSSANVLRFQPSNPVGTLENYLTAAELIAGPAGGGTNIYQLSWYNNNLAFNFHSTTGARGFYVVPEPASLGLLALGGLVVLRRRSR